MKQLDWESFCEQCKAAGEIGFVDVVINPSFHAPESSELVELLETGSVTVVLDSKVFVISLRVTEEAYDGT